MADKSERSKEVEVEITLDEAKKLIQEKAKSEGEISMKEIAEKLTPYSKLRFAMMVITLDLMRRNEQLSYCKLSA